MHRAQHRPRRCTYDERLDQGYVQTYLSHTIVLAVENPEHLSDQRGVLDVFLLGPPDHGLRNQEGEGI